MKLKEKQLTHKLVYKNLFMNIYLDDVLLPNDKVSKRIYLKHNGAGAVLPITKDNKLILIKQYRYPVDKILYEIPAGKKDFIKESGIDCVSRELEEETGYVSNEFKKIIDLHNCVGYSSEIIELFIAKNCEKIESPKKGDDDEFIDIQLVTIEEARQLLKRGEITDSKTLVALQYYFLEEINA